MVDQHKELVKGYVKVHGGGWYLKDDSKKTMTLYGSSGDYGEPRLSFLNRIPRYIQTTVFALCVSKNGGLAMFKLRQTTKNARTEPEVVV